MAMLVLLCVKLNKLTTKHLVEKNKKIKFSVDKQKICKLAKKKKKKEVIKI
jgi:hypothetical protein